MTDQEFHDQYIRNWQPTPLVQKDGIFFKLEHKNPTGSVKSRGLVWQIYQLLRDGRLRAVISSSGNAAIAAADYCEKAGIGLSVFISPRIAPEKLERLKRYPCQIIQYDQPVAQATRMAQEQNVPYLRQSLDPVATKGFEQLAVELCDQLGQTSVDYEEVSIFFPVGSATTLVGFYRGLVSLKFDLPQIHVVQTAAVHPIASQFDQDFKRKARSIVGGIVARETARADEAVQAIRMTDGWGWVVSDDQVQQAQTWLKERGVAASREGSLALAGYWKAHERGFVLKKHPLIILT